MATITTTPTTGETGSGGGNIIRITGMASGLDVDSLVTKMLSSDQIKIDSANQANQLVQWKQSDYTSIIAGINSLQTSFLDITDPTTSVLSSTAYSAFDVDSVDPTALSVSSDGTAAPGAYAVSFERPVGDTIDPAVGNLASAASVVSSGALMTTAVPSVLASDTSTLANIGFSSPHSLTINYNNNDGTGAKTAVIPFTPDTTLGDLVTAINTATGNSVNARFSDLTGELSIGTSATGVATTISVSSDAGVLAKLKLGTTTTTSTTSTSSTGVNANVYITPPGATIGTLTTQASNNFSIDGVTYGLTAQKDSSFSIVSDPQKVYNKINTFLTAYNVVVNQLQTAVSAVKDPAYPPLTASQETSMSADQISAWNVKAQVGVLNNDPNLTAMLNAMRSAFTDPINATATSLAFGQYGSNAIGIDTSTDITQGGKMTIVNQTQLMNAITNHPDQVQAFFAGTSTATSPSDQYNAQGIFTRLNTIVKNNVGLIGTSYNTGTLTSFANVQDNYSTTGGVGNNTIPDQLFYQQQLMTTLNAKLAADSTKYYNQFSALEVSMDNMTAQMAEISSYSTSLA